MVKNGKVIPHSQQGQSAALVRGDMVGLVAFDLVLRVGFGGMMNIPLELEIGGVNSDDRARYPARF